MLSGKAESLVNVIQFKFIDPMVKNIIPILLITFVTITAQTENIFFPSNLNVQPFTASAIEPSLGFLFQLNKNELRLNIGNSMDIVQFRFEDNTTISIGIDLFTYTLLRSEKNFHFPVDAVDYLFGFNAGFKKTINTTNEFGARLRLSHISAHFVDGHFDNRTQSWRDGLAPRVYSREFIEFMPYYKWNSIRIYAGFTYIYHVDPVDLGKDSYQFGFEYFADDLINDFLTPFIAYDFKLVNLYAYTGNNSLSAGIKFGNYYGRGFSIFVNYYAGKSIHGQYFNFNREFTALVLNLDL